MNKKPVRLLELTFGDRDRTWSKNERAADCGYFKEVESDAGGICAFNTLEEVASREYPDEKGDSRILADLELLREKADNLTKLDNEIMDLLLRADTREDELDKEMQGADQYAHEYKRLNLHVQRCLNAAIKM